MTLDKDIKEAVKNKKLVIGRNLTIKNLKNGSIQTIIIASNCPDEIKKNLKHYANLSNIKITEFKENSSRLGEICAKPFNILIAGIKK